MLRQLKFEDRQTFGIYQQRPPSIFLQGSKETLNGIEISAEKGSFYSKQSRQRRVAKTSFKEY